jgi:regulator of sirC expression with transglutaminase-like and TPR domain
MAAAGPSARRRLARLGQLGDDAGLAQTALLFSALHGRPGTDARLDQLADGAGSGPALAIIWLEVAWRAGWEAEALRFPGMMPIRLTDAHGHRAIADPAADGHLLQAADLRAALKAAEGIGAELHPDHFAPLGNRDILLALQDDAKLKALMGGRVAEALAVVEGMLAFSPERETLWREAGMMHLRLDNLPAAIAALEQFAARTHNDTARRRTQHLLQDLRARMH